MPSRRRSDRRTAFRRHRAAMSRLLRRLVRAWRGLVRPDPVEVLSADRRRRDDTTRGLRRGLRRLRRALGDRFPAGLVVLAQDTVPGPFPALTTRCGSAVVVRLSLRAGDRRLDPDELLAALADAVLAIAEGPANHRAAGQDTGAVHLLPDPLAA